MGRDDKIPITYQRMLNIVVGDNETESTAACNLGRTSIPIIRNITDTEILSQTEPDEEPEQNLTNLESELLTSAVDAPPEIPPDINPYALITGEGIMDRDLEELNPIPNLINRTKYLKTRESENLSIPYLDKNNTHQYCTQFLTALGIDSTEQRNFIDELIEKHYIVKKEQKLYSELVINTAILETYCQDELRFLD